MRFNWRNLAWSCGLLAIVSCSGDQEPRRGQIMLALQTDMSIPKDVNRIRLQVLVGDELQHDETYPVAPEPRGTKLPATLAIVAGNTPNPAVQVRVIGIRDTDAGVLARTFAKVVTTVPRERIATLRVPIQWLCDGSARETADGEYKSTCKPDGDVERACVAGTCKPVDVDSSKLPDYTPEDIFGGDPGPNGFFGVCFDTAPCFDAGVDRAPTGSCRLNLDVPKGGNVNVALKFPAAVDGEEGTGICGEEGCYVPLDRDDTFGWRFAGGMGQPGAAGDTGDPDGGPVTVELPEGVCERLDAGEFDAVRVSYACQTKTPTYPTCGPWSAVEEGTVVGEDVGGAGGTGGLGGTGGSGNSGGDAGNGGDAGTGGSGGTTLDACAGLSGSDGAVQTGDAAIDEYVRAVQAFALFVDQYRMLAEQGCKGLTGSAASGLSDTELVTECDAAAAEVTRLVESGPLNLVLAKGYCAADTDLQQACEESCGADACSSIPYEQRCQAYVGHCESGGSCEDGCYGDVNTPATCEGSCFGQCKGSCSGRCTAPDGSVPTEECLGLCQGTCLGTCEGDCVATSVCDTTCLANDPGAVCGGNGSGIVCQTPLSTEACSDDLCAASCSLEGLMAQSCEVSFVRAFASSLNSDGGVTAEDRMKLEMNLGPLADAVLQTQDLELVLSQLNDVVGQIAPEDYADNPAALACLSEALSLHAQAIGSLNITVQSASAAVNAVAYTDVSIEVPGSGGSTGVGGQGTGGFPGTGGSRGGAAGAGGSPSGAGGSPPLANCGFGDYPNYCQLCLAEICCDQALACDADPFCGPVAAPDSEHECMRLCQLGYGYPDSYCEAQCAKGGDLLSSATVDLMYCGGECYDCQVPQ